MVSLNCAALPDTLMESELFGYRRGAFTGAQTDKAGLVASAEGGTLFLDEIAELTLLLQAKLLRFLEDGVYFPLGATRPSRSDVRIIAATNADLAKRVDTGVFRRDLYFRLSARHRFDRLVEGGGRCGGIAGGRRDAAGADAFGPVSHL